MQIYFDYDSEILSLDSLPPMIGKLLPVLLQPEYQAFPFGFGAKKDRGTEFLVLNRTETLDTQATCTYANDFQTCNKKRIELQSARLSACFTCRILLVSVEKY